MSLQNDSNSKPTKKRSSDRRLLTRIARDKTSSALAQALSELAEEKTWRRVLETRLEDTTDRLNAFIDYSVELRQELSDLTDELARLRAADAPSILDSIALVLRYQEIVVGKYSPVAVLELDQLTRHDHPMSHPQTSTLRRPWTRAS